MTVRAHRQGVGDGADHQRDRASDTSFNVRWTEQRFVNGALAGTERWNAVISVLQTPRTEQRLRKNPLGIYVNGLSWSRELDSSEGAKP
jgi:type IV secretion system protein VirB5